MTSDKGTEVPESPIEPAFLKLDDVAAHLNISVPQTYALVRSGELPAIKIGGRGIWRVARAQLDAYIERLHESTAEWTKSHPLTPRDNDGGEAEDGQEPGEDEGDEGET